MPTLKYICCGTPSPTPPSSESSFGEASTVEQIYQAYDDYFEAIPMQTLPQPMPPMNRRTPRPANIVLPQSIYGMVGRTYVPVTQKLPPLRDARSYDEVMAQRLLGRLDAMRDQALQRYALPSTVMLAPPRPPPRSASLPKEKRPKMPDVPLGMPMPPPRTPNFARPLPTPPMPFPPPCVVAAPLRLPAPTVPLPPLPMAPREHGAWLSPADASRPQTPVQGLKPLRLPQMVAERQSLRRPLQLPKSLFLPPPDAPPVPRLPKPSDLPYLQPLSPFPRMSPSPTPQPAAPSAQRPKAAYFD